MVNAPGRTVHNFCSRHQPLKQRLIVSLKRMLWWFSPRALDSFAAPHRGQTYSIGIYTGESPLELTDPDDIANPVLTREDVTDVPAAFVADPFMLLYEGRWYMFMEVFNRLNRCGEIGFATSDDGKSWEYDQIVLRERFHLAYPFLLRWRGKIYMIPDAPGRGARLYQATAFPYSWTFVRELISERNLTDSTVFHYHDRWWMLAGWSPERGDPPSLRLFFSDELAGDWREHPDSPLLTRSSEKARPAGPVLKVNDRMFRVAQDCTPNYGTRVKAFEILELTETRYRERELEENIIVEPGDRPWHRGGMHHVHAHPASEGRWIACVDGWYPPESGR
jgi:hypothetical protein